MFLADVNLTPEQIAQLARPDCITWVPLKALQAIPRPREIYPPRKRPWC